MRFLKRALCAAVRGDLIYTPTPHPLPFARRQVVVFHDPFPFEGPGSRLKRWLLRLGVASSRCVVAYINRSVAEPWLLGLGVPRERLLFAPNVPPAIAAAARPSPPVAHGAAPRRAIRIGAFGTDSPKKHYPQLLEELAKPPYRGRMQLCIFGGANAYARRLVHDFASCPPALVDPGATSLRDFILDLDAVVSVAAGEGFGRPIATAIGLGVPCCLIESPTFREFFGGLAWLEPDIPRLLQRVLDVASGQLPPRAAAATGFLAPAYTRAIDAAVGAIRLMA